MPAPRQPDWNVSFLNTDTQEKGLIGVAWNNDDGSIYFKLNPMVVLTAAKNIQVRLFRRTNRGTAKDPDHVRDDDTPF